MDLAVSFHSKRKIPFLGGEDVNLCSTSDIQDLLHLNMQAEVKAILYPSEQLPLDYCIDMLSQLKELLQGDEYARITFAEEPIGSGKVFSPTLVCVVSVESGRVHLMFAIYIPRASILKSVPFKVHNPLSYVMSPSINGKKDSYVVAGLQGVEVVSPNRLLELLIPYFDNKRISY